MNFFRTRVPTTAEKLDRELPGPFHHTRSMFIHIPKAAGTSVSVALYGYSVGHATVRKRFETDYESAKDYFKFTFVRDPVDRLVSVFRFFKGGGMHERDREFSNLHVYDRDFPAFVKWLEQPGALEKHLLLRPQMHFISTDDKRILVNFVGRYENLKADFATVAERIGVKAKLPHMNKSASREIEVDVALRHRIKQIYEIDYTWLGY